MRGALVVSAGLAALLFSVTSEAAPVADLPLTCPSSQMIGQPQNNCSGLTYQSPSSDQLIVLRSNGAWARASTLANSDTLAVCSLPVEPGTYSSCKDAGGVRRIVYLPKSQVFTTSQPPPPPPPPPPSSGARILDLSQPPVFIREPGLYVLDRDWENVASPGIDRTSIMVYPETQGRVTIDLQGFTLTTEGNAIAVGVAGFTLRNGRIRAGSGADGGGGVSVGEPGALIENVSIQASAGFGAVALDWDSTVRNSELRGTVALHGYSQFTDNKIECLGTGFCVSIGGLPDEGTLFARNKIHSNGDGIQVFGDESFVLDNLIIGNCSRLGTAISVVSEFSVIRNNVIAGCDGRAGWAQGIEFLEQDGNSYGSNTVWATTPFNVGATVQTDLGGNVGLSN